MYTLNKEKLIVPAEHRDSVARAIFALEEGFFTKIICGAANTNEKHVERLSLIYALSGVHAIDVSPSQKIIESAKSGIKKASEIYKDNPLDFPAFKEPVLMASINAGNDLHFRKAEINNKNCTNCRTCINFCPANALYVEKNQVTVNKNNCYGCGKCSTACLQKAISFSQISNSLDSIIDMVEALEIHTGNNSVEEVKNFLELNVSLLKNKKLLSFCIESSRFNITELQNYANSLTKLVDQKIIIQIDGIPMGATDRCCSSLQSISAAAALLESNLDAYVQLSGGTNQFTKKMVQQLGLKISGIGYGTFARKIILSYLEELEDDFVMQLKRIVNITTNLVGN